MKTLENQEKVWDNIAPDWYKHKVNSSEKDLEFIKSQKGKMLDIGCATGRHFTKTKAEIYAVDFSKEMIKLAKKRAKEKNIKKIKFFVSDAQNLPFEDYFFDSVFCVAMLHCIPSKKGRKKALKEIYRVLKKGGESRIVVWNKESGRFKNKKKEDTVKWIDKGTRYYYFYTEKELEKDLKEIGFKITFQLSKFKGVPFHSLTFIAKK